MNFTTDNLSVFIVFWVMLYWLIHHLLQGYICSMICFLVFINQQKKRRKDFLNIGNLIVLIVLTINLGLAIHTAIFCYGDQSGLLSRNCITNLVLTFFSGFLFQWIFLYKKFRVKVWTTVISVVLTLMMINMESIIVAITNLFRDYIPSSWAMYYAPTIWNLVFPVFYFSACWIGSSILMRRDLSQNPHGT